MKIVLAVICGFSLNTALRSTYSYFWWTSVGKLTNSELNKSFKETGDYRIVEDRMGIVSNVKFLVYTPTYNFRKWSITY